VGKTRERSQQNVPIQEVSNGLGKESPRRAS
jgi:hypothetical protein